MDIMPIQEARRRRRLDSSLGTYITTPLAGAEDLPISPTFTPTPLAPRPTPVVMPTAPTVPIAPVAPLPGSSAAPPQQTVAGTQAQAIAPNQGVKAPLSNTMSSVQATANQMQVNPQAAPAAGSVKKMTETDKLIQATNDAMAMGPARKPRELFGMPAASVGAALGKAAQAIMGPYQQTPAAQFGKLAQEMNEGQIYADALADAREGREFTKEVRSLTPEQQNQLYAVQTLAQDRKLNALKQKFDMVTKAEELGLNKQKIVADLGLIAAQTTATTESALTSKAQREELTNPNSVSNLIKQQELEIRRIDAETARTNADIAKVTLANLPIKIQMEMKTLDIELQNALNRGTLQENQALEIKKSIEYTELQIEKLNQMPDPTATRRDENIKNIAQTLGIVGAQYPEMAESLRRFFVSAHPELADALNGMEILDLARSEGSTIGTSTPTPTPNPNPNPNPQRSEQFYLMQDIIKRDDLNRYQLGQGLVDPLTKRLFDSLSPADKMEILTTMPQGFPQADQEMIIRDLTPRK